MNDPVNQPLQDFSFERSQYQRPNQPVVYVPLPDGEEVVSKGQELYRKPAVSQDDSEKPILKMRSLRKRRGIFSFSMTALTLGFLLIGFNSRWSKEFIAPGPLSSPHGQILGKLGSDRCAACHESANQSFGDWAMTAVGFSADSTGHGSDGTHRGALHQSQLCMKCHGDSFDSSLALNPHGVSVELLDELTKKAGGDWSSGVTQVVAAGLGMSHGGSIACSACHREHHGNVGLSQLTDQQCQSCHQQTFHSFEEGHPEFSSAPQERRQRIAFDHGTHLNKHFPANKTHFDCAQCHIDDPTIDAKLTAPFEQSCGACHDQQIVDSGERGWAMFTLPMIDMKAVEQHGLRVGNWPMLATGDFDGPLPPMMGVLLWADADCRAVLERLGDDFEFGDIDPGDRNSVADAVDLVWGIKRLLRDLAIGGREAIREKFTRSTGRDISGERLTKMLAGLDPMIFAATAKRWLPDLERDLATVGGSKAVSQSGHQLRRRSETNLFAATVQGRLAPQELLAENPLLGESFETTEPVSVPETLASPPSESSLDLSARPRPPKVAAGSELLVENPLSSPNASSLSLDSQASAALATSEDRRSDRDSRSSLALKIPQEIQIISRATGAAFRPGWFRSDSRFEIGYRPAQHADALVKSWSDFAAAGNTVGGANRSDWAMDRLFAAVTETTAAGNCRSCHTVDQQAAGGYEFQWCSDRRDFGEARFTKFSHRPHLILPQLQDCNYCHRMDESKSLVGSFDGFESMVPTEFSSNFHPSTKADCAACHRKGHTESGCMQCHNYHVGRKRTARQTIAEPVTSIQD